MAKQLQIIIPTPCHENWDNMTPVDKGKFCGSCQKQVIDFSNMSDRQVAEFFKKPSNGSVCGRFMTDQLERDIEIPKKRIPWVKYFFQFVLPTFLVSIKPFSAKAQRKGMVKSSTALTKQIVQSHPVAGEIDLPLRRKPLMGDTILIDKVVITAQVDQPQTGQSSCSELPNMQLANMLSGRMGSGIITTKSPDISEIGDLSISAVVHQERTIYGIVTDHSGDPIPGATVFINGKGTCVTTDPTGNFKLLAKTGDILLAGYPGFESTEITVATKDVVSLSLMNLIVAGSPVIITARRAIKRTKKLNKNISLYTPAFHDTASNYFKTFPNPVSPGSNLSIENRKIEEGYYQLQILNLVGQTIQQKEIWIDAEARLLNIDVPSVAAGSYFLVLTNKKTGKKFSEKIIVQ